MRVYIIVRHMVDREIVRFYFCAPFAMRYSLDCVRSITLPRTTAGVASAISFKEFLPSNLYSGPA